jgi:hypothetical protein
MRENIELIKQFDILYSSHNPLRNQKIGLDRLLFIPIIEKSEVLKCRYRGDSNLKTIGVHIDYLSLIEKNITKEKILYNTLKEHAKIIQKELI